MKNAHDHVGDARPETVGTLEMSGDSVVLRCWPDKHWVGEVRRGGVLRLWDRRCKKYLLFRLGEILEKLNRKK